MAELDRNGVIYIREHPTAYDLKHIGDKIGQLTAISPVIILNKEIIPRKNEREKYWVFLCSCGKKVCRPLRSVKRGMAKDCGCTKDEKTDARYIGKKFGRLMVEERDYAYKFENGLKTKDKYFLCRCDCGNRIVVRLSHLLSGEIVSCGCFKRSQVEQKIAKVLDDNGIKYVYDKPFFDDLILPGGCVGRFDFVLLDANDKPYRIIECDGVQHNTSTKYPLMHGKDLSRLWQYDTIKNEYAMKHGIPLVRIPYSEKGAITLDLLFSDKYLVSA